VYNHILLKYYQYWFVLQRFTELEWFNSCYGISVHLYASHSFCLGMVYCTDV